MISQTIQNIGHAKPRMATGRRAKVTYISIYLNIYLYIEGYLYMCALAGLRLLGVWRVLLAKQIDSWVSYALLDAKSHSHAG